jgi:hypothetical protein
MRTKEKVGDKRQKKSKEKNHCPWIIAHPRLFSCQHFFSSCCLPWWSYLHQGHIIFAKVVLPQLESLGADILPQIESLMTAMYTVSIPEFQPGNRLYPILKICMVSIIMHHIDFERDCLPQNRVSSMLQNAAARAKNQ